MSERVGIVAVVTGAGSGLGRALSIGLARRGCRLALADVSQEGLEVTRVRAEALGVPVLTTLVDVADRAAMVAFATRVRERYGVVDQVYANAGVASFGERLSSTPPKEVERVVGVNFWGVVHAAQAFLPHLVESGRGRLVAVSSLNGYVPQAGLVPYCASKYAVRGFAESLGAEVRADGLPVRVTVVHPGGIATNIASASLEHLHLSGRPVTAKAASRVEFYNRALLRLPAHAAAETILEGVAAGRERILVGPDAKVLDIAVRLAPTWAPTIATWVEKKVFAPR